MKTNEKKNSKLACLTAALSAATLCSLHAYDLTLGTNMPPIAVHGFASQGFLLSDEYNYLAPDTKNGSFQFSEFGLNVAMNPFPRTRIAVQGFDFDAGTVGQYDPFLDYALIEYTFNDELGIRAGRIRRPSGIYNAIQDIDVARTFVLLPQGMYDARWRDWSAGLDGGELFGDIQLPTHKLGDISYEAYAGKVTMQENGGVSRYAAYANDVSVDTMDDTPVFGAQVWHNTPLDGLRFGANVTYMSNFGLRSDSSTTYYGYPADIASHSVGNVLLQQYSAEYTWKQWTFQAEYYTYELTGWSHGIETVPALNASSPGLQTFYDHPQTWYVAASHRFNKYFEAGAYYSKFRDFAWNVFDPLSHQNDAVLCLRFDPTDWWVFKIEGHYITGAGLLRDQNDNPSNLGASDSGWFMLAIKTTVSF